MRLDAERSSTYRIFAEYRADRPELQLEKPWVWSIDLAFSHGRDPVHGFAATREAAMRAFARSWFGENQP
jgi:hypothetical protein